MKTRSYTNPLKTGALAALLAGLSRPTPSPEAAKEPRPFRAFRINGQTFHAFTRSEARARAKAKFGWERIPAGMAIEEVTAPATVAA